MSSCEQETQQPCGLGTRMSSLRDPQRLLGPAVRSQQPELAASAFAFPDFIFEKLFQKGHTSNTSSVSL